MRYQTIVFFGSFLDLFVETVLELSCDKLYEVKLIIILIIQQMKKQYFLMKQKQQSVLQQGLLRNYKNLIPQFSHSIFLTNFRATWSIFSQYTVRGKLYQCFPKLCAITCHAICARNINYLFISVSIVSEKLSNHALNAIKQQVL